MFIDFSRAYDSINKNKTVCNYGKKRHFEENHPNGKDVCLLYFLYEFNSNLVWTLFYSRNLAFKNDLRFLIG